MAALALACAAAGSSVAAQVVTPHPVLFVTQVPVASDFAVVVSTFANHGTDMDQAPRGGDLVIRYPDGALRNLTAEAGYGSAGFQGTAAIAVRDPDVHWSGERAVFSMVIGAPDQQYQQRTDYWQLYEVTGLGQGETVAITRVVSQPEDYNNVDAAYAADGSIVFASDRPRDGQRHLYPQHDEYESTPTVSGLWKLAGDGTLTLLQHSPSGSFDPMVDSYGRIVFTRWDHLQQDQQAEADIDALSGGGASVYGTFDFADESAGAALLDQRIDVFPEPRYATAGVAGLRFNSFGPWTVNHDGTGEETLNHVGRHELHSYFERSFTGDAALEDFVDEISGRSNPNSILNVFQIAEDPAVPGRYVAIDAPEFDTNGAGQLIAFDAPPTLNAEDFVVQYLTPRSTFDTAPAADHSGHYRDPLPLSDGRLLAVHSAETGGIGNTGTPTAPDPTYDFRLRLMAAGPGGMLVPGDALTGGIEKTVSWYTPDVLISYTGPLWELSPVEVRARTLPTPTTEPALPAPELGVFAAAGVDVSTFRAWLEARGLAVLSIRNVTSRDDIDLQQPFDLAVPGGTSTTAPGAGDVREVSHLQFFQADQVRGIGGLADPDPGRRPVARVLHDPQAIASNPAPAGTPAGSVVVAGDGSAAAFVPGQRALSWQLLAPDGSPVVRERYWITAQPGEVRACDGCHGINASNQAGDGPADNAPQALALLLAAWKQETGRIFANGFD